jgi:hypothetical protein
MSDPVNQPDHYTVGGIETIDYIQAKLTPEQFEGYLLGNVIKYVSRHGHKNGYEDLRKAQWYLDKAVYGQEPTPPYIPGKNPEPKTKPGEIEKPGDEGVRIEAKIYGLERKPNELIEEFSQRVYDWQKEWQKEWHQMHHIFNPIGKEDA